MGKMSKNPLALALKKLSSRAYSQKELERYLAKFDFSQEQTEEVVTKLLSWGYLDDQKLAMDWYTYYTTKKPHGFIYIYKKLQEKGIPEQLITSLLADYDEKKELKLARSLAEKIIVNKTNRKSPRQLKNMLARHLYCKGFSKVNIMIVLEENFPETF
jgi:regulatory protein